MSRFSEELVGLANHELAQYGHLVANQSPLSERIAAYWKFLGPEPPFTAWSAAFISYMAQLAGAGDTFRYSCRHSEYVHRAINAHLAQDGSAFLGFRPEALSIGPGDIVGMNRSNAAEIDYEWAVQHDHYTSHCDIVVRVTDEEITTIGGNVGPAPGTVGTKTWLWRNGTLANAVIPAQRVFVVIRSVLP